MNDALNGVSEADTEYSRYERALTGRGTWMEVLIGAGRSTPSIPTEVSDDEDFRDHDD